MKLLKAEGGLGHYLADKGAFSTKDKINKDDQFWLVNLPLREEDIEFDDYDENAIKNQAHQVIYKNIVQKLVALRARRKAFIDESERLYLIEYEKYREDIK